MLQLDRRERALRNAGECQRAGAGAGRIVEWQCGSRAGGLVDFALGSDCGGSVCIPASYCGIFGMRPTWGRVPLEGALPFGPSFDVAGWLTRSPDLFERVGRVLLQDQSPPERPRRLLMAKDAFSLV